MAKKAGTSAGVDDAHGWDARLGWAFDLIADDPAERGAALGRLADARGNVGDALRRWNELWHLTLPLGGQEQYRDPTFLQAYERYREAGKYVLPDALWNRPPGDMRTWPGLPYALLFLEWEARYPQEWTRHAKKWGTKQGLIRDVAVADHSETVRTKLTDLVEVVVQRRYRCKDREYLRVARAVDSDDLRARLETAARSHNPWARRHVGYVLWLLDRPEVPNTIHVWQTWNAAEATG
ncbi:hypothetical protein [Streptomyces sp. NBC_01304]|uniref:hypothetical protein n=1 Tax=Streptomyces sp. NBC_01304 TaxID=2903818 RepID=UPI002E0FFD8A|nr:hypothetical protein OG430_02935 [Streptomyces sp. NBC_01304]